MIFIFFLFLFSSVISFVYRIKAVKSLDSNFISSSDRNNNISDSRLWLVMPCRGIDLGMNETVRKLKNIIENNKFINVLFIVDKKEDQAYELILKFFSEENILVLNKFDRIVTSLKNEALFRAFEKLETEASATDILIFLDSDAEVDFEQINKIKAIASINKFVTGYRYYSIDNNFNSSVVSAISDELMIGLFIEKARFLWGGLMAATMENWIKIGIPDRWKNSISDDCEATLGAEESNFEIYFINDFFRKSHFKGSFYDSFNFAKRQLQMVYLYRKSAFLIFQIIKTINIVFLLLCIFNLSWYILFYFVSTMLNVVLQLKLNPYQNRSDAKYKIIFAPLHQVIISIAGIFVFFDHSKIQWRGINYIVNNEGKVLKRW